MAAAVCPATPLLARDLTGSDPVVPELRQACLDATDVLMAAGPHLVVVVGEAAVTRDWPADAALDLAAFAPALRGKPGRMQADGGSAAGAARGALPVSVGLGSMLLDQASYAGPRLLWSASQDDTAADCAALGTRLVAGQDRVALLVMADGSARRTPRAPGYLDERSAPFDAAVERAIAGDDLQALMSVDAQLARELMATGRPAWQVLAGAARGVRTDTRVRYSDDPFGVFYLVASIRCDPQADVVTFGNGHASWTV